MPSFVWHHPGRWEAGASLPDDSSSVSAIKACGGRQTARQLVHVDLKLKGEHVVPTETIGQADLLSLVDGIVV